MPPAAAAPPKTTLRAWKKSHGWAAPGARLPRWSCYTLRDVHCCFMAFPNGHKRFLTKAALAKLNLGREDAVNTAEHPLDPEHSPWLTDRQRRQAQQRQPHPGAAPAAQAQQLPAYRWWLVPVPPLVGESMHARRAPSRDAYSAAPARRPARRCFVSVAEWARDGDGDGDGAPRPGRPADRLPGTHAAGAGAGRLFGPYRAPRPEAPAAPALGGVDDAPPDETSHRAWDRRSTAVPEVPTLTGSAGGDGIQTLRLRALGKGRGLDLWQGDTITLRVSGRGPMNGRTVTLVVEDIVYGDRAYINMLVDGGTTMSGGGRSRSTTSAFVRVSERNP